MEKIETDITFSYETKPCQKTEFEKKNYRILTFFVCRFGISSGFLHGFFPAKMKNIQGEPLRINFKPV